MCELAEVLSQNEVESLLAALDPSGGQGGSTHAPTAPRMQDFGRQISVYDFKRPERVSKEQMRAFQALHDGFSREFGASLSGMLRSIIEVKLISVDQLTYSEFVFSLENPTCFNLLFSKGLDGHIILDLNPSIIFPIIDRLMGGGKSASNTLLNRPLTDIELKLVSRITKLAIQSLNNTWSKICDLDLNVTQIESNPQLVQIVPPNEVIVLISFEITMSDVRGVMNLCIPYNTIEPLSGKLSSDTWSSYTQKTLDPLQRVHLETNVAHAAVEMVIELASTKLTASEVYGLDVGDVIMTDHEVASGVKVIVEGRSMFLAQPGVFRGQKAIEIRSKVTHSKDEIQDRLTKLGISKAPPIPERVNAGKK
jgi:flagellar motor switch protein FliM